jgi:uncharacterized protein
MEPRARAEATASTARREARADVRELVIVARRLSDPGLRAERALSSQSRDRIEAGLVTSAQLALVAAVFALGAAAQAASGFGFALLAIPLLSIVVGPKTAVVATSMIGLGFTGFMVVHNHRHVDRRAVLVAAAAGSLGMPFGLWIITHAGEATLRGIIAAVVLVFTLLLWRGLSLPDRTVTDAGAGLASGVLSTSTGTNGPPLVVAFHAKGLAPSAFRATLAAVFAFQGLVALSAFALTGQVTERTAAVAAAGVPGVVVGWVAGQWAFRRTDPAMFRHLVLAMLALSGLIGLLAALSG